MRNFWVLKDCVICFRLGEKNCARKYHNSNEDKFFNILFHVFTPASNKRRFSIGDTNIKKIILQTLLRCIWWRGPLFGAGCIGRCRSYCNALFTAFFMISLEIVAPLIASTFHVFCSTILLTIASAL